jgi:hypothetical protein
MSQFPFARSQLHADRFIKRWGNAGFLIRDGVKRKCFIARQDYSPRERGLFLDGAERMYISAYHLSVGPDHEQDTIEWNGTLYKIVAPVVGPRPAAVTIFYDCSVMRTGPAT